MKLYLAADGSSGLLVLPNDGDQLAESLQAVLTDHERRNKVSQGARSHAWQFDTAGVVPRVVLLYEMGRGYGNVKPTGFVIRGELS